MWGAGSAEASWGGRSTQGTVYCSLLLNPEGSDRDLTGCNCPRVSFLLTSLYLIQKLAMACLYLQASQPGERFLQLSLGLLQLLPQPLILLLSSRLLQ